MKDGSIMKYYLKLINNFRMVFFHRMDKDHEGGEVFPTMNYSSDGKNES